MANLCKSHLKNAPVTFSEFSKTFSTSPEGPEEKSDGSSAKRCSKSLDSLAATPGPWSRALMAEGCNSYNGYNMTT